MAGAVGSKVGRHEGRQEMRQRRDCPKNTGDWRESRGPRGKDKSGMVGEQID